VLGDIRFAPLASSFSLECGELPLLERLRLCEGIERSIPARMAGTCAVLTRLSLPIVAIRAGSKMDHGPLNRRHMGYVVSHLPVPPSRSRHPVLLILAEELPDCSIDVSRGAVSFKELPRLHAVCSQNLTGAHHRTLPFKVEATVLRRFRRRRHFLWHWLAPRPRTLYPKICDVGLKSKWRATTPDEVDFSASSASKIPCQCVQNRSPRYRKDSS
jgi:hypothetical protein